MSEIATFAPAAIGDLEPAPETTATSAAAGTGSAEGAVTHPTSAPSTAVDELVNGELIVEEISIDGMCGVY